MPLALIPNTWTIDYQFNQPLAKQIHFKSEIKKSPNHQFTNSPNHPITQ